MRLGRALLGAGTAAPQSEPALQALFLTHANPILGTRRPGGQYRTQPLSFHAVGLVGVNFGAPHGFPCIPAHKPYGCRS